MIRIIILISIIGSIQAQDRTTQNLDEALLLLDSSWPTNLKEAISTTKEEDLFRDFGNAPHVFELVDIKGKSTPYQAYFSQIGIDKWNYVLHITLDAYKRKLLGLPLENQKLLQHYQSLTLRKRYEKTHATEVDTIAGIYIPKDINDCIIQLDAEIGKIFPFEVQKITEVEFVGCCYLGLHVWVRNNWKILPNRSRLAKFFNEQGLYDPCEITRIILTCYYRRKNNQYVGFEEMIEASTSK